MSFSFLQSQDYLNKFCIPISWELVLILNCNHLVLNEWFWYVLVLTFIAIMLIWCIEMNSFMRWVNIYDLLSSGKFIYRTYSGLSYVCVNSFYFHFEQLEGLQTLFNVEENVEMARNIKLLYLRNLRKGNLITDATVCSEYFVKLFAFPFRIYRARR